MLLQTSTSRVIINGQHTEAVQHRRQGYPISPFLFILAINPLQRMMNLATTCGVLTKLPGRRPMMRCSFYADDVAMFMNPKESDATMIQMLLKCFAQASGLPVNARKSSALPIRCGLLNLDSILAPLGIPRKSFPITYLGMQLSLYKPNQGRSGPATGQIWQQDCRMEGWPHGKEWSPRATQIWPYCTSNLYDDGAQAFGVGVETAGAALSCMAMERREHL